MEITPEQARAAFYKAAENIENNPSLYDFASIKIDGECGACMWGHVGRALNLSGRISVVRKLLGLGAGEIYSTLPGGFDHPPTNRLFHLNAAAAAARLRAFADYRWPAESTTHVRPDLQVCGMTFEQLIQTLNAGGEVA